MPTRGPNFDGPEDLSNSQYVLLALWAGTRCGYELDAETMASIARRLLDIQVQDGPPMLREPDPDPEVLRRHGRYAPPRNYPREIHDRARGFGYTPGDIPTGSMTVAGMSSLVIIKAMMMEHGVLAPDLSLELDQGIWDAIAWLARNFSVHGNPPNHGALWHYYYLYGLERACVIAGKRFLGQHDWYREGAELLLDAQQSDGSWEPPNPLNGFGRPGQGGQYRTVLLDTCFALLFLKRATVRPKQPVLPAPTITPREEDETPAEDGGG
jgi:hypothetical protein